MKFFILLLWGILPASLSGQDYIYLKNTTVILARVLDIGLDKIRYKRTDVPRGPTYEILKSDVIRIIYRNGAQDTFGQATQDSGNDGQNTRHDSIDYSMLYILYNSGDDESMKVPVYINGEYIVTLNNHMRATYKLFSEGNILLERKEIRTYGHSPAIQFGLTHGDCFGIRIEVLDPQGWSSYRRLSMTLISDSSEFKRFLDEEYFAFKPYKSCDLKLVQKPKKK